MYTRKFIILRKDLGTITGRNPKGHGKLEIKGPRGFVSLTIENAGEQNVYNVVFISKEKSSPILNLGKIFTDDVGRGKGDYSFMLKDVLLDSIKGILVMKDKEILLGGYIDKEDGTIERYIETIFEMPSIEEDNTEPSIEEFLMEPEPEYIPEETIFEESPLEELTNEEITTEEEVSEEVDWREAISEELNMEIKADDVEDIVSDDMIQEIEVDLGYEHEEDDMEPDYNTINYIKKLNQKNQTTNYVLSILRFFPYVDPFKYDIKGYNWWKVELDTENEYKSFLPYFSYLSGGNNKESYESSLVTCNELMEKYQHYLFGLYNENEQVKYFVYGVPGSFIKAEHPNKGLNGFNTWYQGVDVEGYWILYIDPMTGKEVVPFNAMSPTN